MTEDGRTEGAKGADGSWETGRIGLIVAEMQTPHEGHIGLVMRALMICDGVILALGSKRKFGVPGHPFTYEQRREMLRIVFGDRLMIVDLDDIDSGADVHEWYDYVSSKIYQAGYPEPTDYFGGSRIDAKWYYHEFADGGEAGEGLPETESPLAPETIGFRTVWTSRRPGGKRLHVVDRAAFSFPSGREIRELIELRDPEWLRYVPERLHRFVQVNYPPHLRRPVSLQWLLDVRRGPLADALAGIVNGVGGFDFALHLRPLDEFMAGVAEAHDYPVGTRLAVKGFEGNLELKDNGKWRRLGIDEKAAWAVSSRSAAV
jgi:hypothetical protein